MKWKRALSLIIHRFFLSFSWGTIFFLSTFFLFSLSVFFSIKRKNQDQFVFFFSSFFLLISLLIVVGRLILSHSQWTWACSLTKQQQQQQTQATLTVLAGQREKPTVVGLWREKSQQLVVCYAPKALNVERFRGLEQADCVIQFCFQVSGLSFSVRSFAFIERAHDDEESRVSEWVREESKERELIVSTERATAATVRLARDLIYWTWESIASSKKLLFAGCFLVHARAKKRIWHRHSLD